MTLLAFVDTETTGLDFERHEVWEVGLVLVDYDQVDVITSGQWQLPVSQLHLAEPMALSLNGFYERYDKDNTITHKEFAAHFGALTAGATLVGFNTAFDAYRLERLLRTYNYAPAWHHRLLDLECLVAGEQGADLPFASVHCGRVLGVEQDADQAHTALGDALYSFEVWKKATGHA